jgi:hypothetical protein
MAKKVENKKVRPLYEIAKEIRNDWGSKIYFGAKPYLGAMLTLDKITDRYMCDDAKTIVSYFLSNACSWRGDVARRVKKELNAMIK